MFQPGAVFATGGYASMPMAVAARLTRTPLLVYLPDVYPGWAVRVAGRRSTGRHVDGGSAPFASRGEDDCHRLSSATGIRFDTA